MNSHWMNSRVENLRHSVINNHDSRAEAIPSSPIDQVPVIETGVHFTTIDKCRQCRGDDLQTLLPLKLRV